MMKRMQVSVEERTLCAAATCEVEQVLEISCFPGSQLVQVHLACGYPLSCVVIFLNVKKRQSCKR